MNVGDIQRLVIAALATRYRNGEREARAADLAADIGAPQAAVCEVIGELHRRQLVETTVGADWCMLTPLGIDRIVQGDPAAPRVSDHRQFHFNGPIHSSALAFDQASASVTNRNAALFQSLAQQIEQHPDLSPQDRKSLAAKVRDLAAHPVVVMILGKLLGS